jgi:hypothetical protein
MKDPILITGCARSGTSLTAGIIHLCGAFGGDMFGPNKYNQKGMFENKEVRQSVVKPYLRKIGVDPLGQKPLPNNRQVFGIGNSEHIEWRNRIQEIYKHQGYIDGEWFYKGAKICLIWLIWHRAFPKAKWIIVRRNREDIANSCMRTAFMRAYTNQKGWLAWVEKHEKRFDEMRQMRLNLFEFWPSRILTGDFLHAEELSNFLELNYNRDLVETFIDPTLYRRSANG